jgi:hypothetical protein
MTFAQIKKRNKSTQNKNNQPFFRSLFNPGKRVFNPREGAA